MVTQEGHMKSWVNGSSILKYINYKYVIGHEGLQK